MAPVGISSNERNQCYHRMRFVLFWGVLSLSTTPLAHSLHIQPTRWVNSRVKATAPLLRRPCLSPSYNSAIQQKVKKQRQSTTATDTATSTSTATQLNMVFSAPESLVEQVSTQTIIDQILDECVRTSARRPIMVQFDPSSKAIWRHWKGTVFAETWRSVVNHMVWSCLVYFLFWKYPAIKQGFSGFGNLWGQLLSVTTFTLTFFVNESYSVWRTILTTCRMLQGRMNDLGMALAGFAQRVDNQNGSSEFTTSSRRILQVVSRYIRLFNIFTYASLTRSHRPLLTPQGMRRMVARGLMTSKERKVLLAAPVAATQRHNVVLMWILRTTIDGRKAGHLDGGFGFEQLMTSKIQEIRAQSNSMESFLRGRMPFAYAHIVQVLIDAVLWMYPFMAFSAGVDLPFHLGVCGTGLLTSSYQGLFDLSKQFLDPFFNEAFWSGEDALVVDTLIAETNAGSLRWMFALDDMPIAYENFRSGDMVDFILPEEGYSKEEADIAEEKKKEKKRREREFRKMASERSTSRAARQYYQEKTAEELETLQEEFENTKLILKAPPGSDFVPGLDDKNATVPFASSEIDENVNKRDNKKEKKNRKDDHDPRDHGGGTVESFIDAAEEEFEETRDELFRGEDTYALGTINATDATTSIGDKFLGY